MKDYLATKLPFKNWKEILRVHGQENAETLIHKISRDNRSDYDRSYAVIRALVEKGRISNMSQMEKVVNKVNQPIAIRFRKKFSAFIGMY